MEWADPLTGGLPACDGCIVRDGTIESCGVGIALDRGTRHTTIRGVTFGAQVVAAIVDDNVPTTNAYSDNDYRGIATRAVAISTAPLPAELSCP